MCCFICLLNDGDDTDLLNYRAIVKINKNVNSVIQVLLLLLFLVIARYMWSWRYDLIYGKA